jgi:hypothetical protein
MDELATFFQIPPKSAWSALLPQILFWSFRRYCVTRISSLDASANEIEPLWDDIFDLVHSHIPEPLKKYVDDWFVPEHVEHMANLPDLDMALRKIVKDLENSILENDVEQQNEIADLLDEGLSIQVEKWLAPNYSHFSVYPTPEESDDDIDDTKLNAILYLLRLKKERKGVKKTHRRAIVDANPVKTEIVRRKTRKYKQNTPHVSVPLPTKTRGDDTRGGETKDNGSESEERKGNEESHDT